MRTLISSDIMSRTTLDIEDPILEEVKRIREREGKPLGRIVSDLLARALADRKADRDAAPEFRWAARALEALVDLEDKEMLHRVLDEEPDA